MAKVSSNKAFRNQKNVRAMAGSIKYSWKPTPSDKRKRPTNKQVPFCDNLTGIDNVVTYVYDILPDGNHSMYVECDYVD